MCLRDLHTFSTTFIWLLHCILLQISVSQQPISHPKDWMCFVEKEESRTWMAEGPLGPLPSSFPKRIVGESREEVYLLSSHPKVGILTSFHPRVGNRIVSLHNFHPHQGESCSSEEERTDTLELATEDNLTPGFLLLPWVQEGRSPSPTHQPLRSLTLWKCYCFRKALSRGQVAAKLEILDEGPERNRSEFF